MATAATIGTSSKLSIDGTGGSSYVEVAELETVSLVMTCTEAEATALNSAGQQMWIPGTRGATISASGNFLPGSHDDAGLVLYTAYQAGTVIGWEITWNAGGSTEATAAGTGIITDLSPSVNGHDQVDTFSLGILVAADVTLGGMATS